MAPLPSLIASLFFLPTIPLNAAAPVSVLPVAPTSLEQTARGAEPPWSLHLGAEGTRRAISSAPVKQMDKNALPTIPHGALALPSFTPALASELPGQLAAYEEKVQSLDETQRFFLQSYQDFTQSLSKRDKDICKRLGYHLDSSKRWADNFYRELLGAEQSFHPALQYSQSTYQQGLPPDLLIHLNESNILRDSLWAQHRNAVDVIIPQMHLHMDKRGCQYSDYEEKYSPELPVFAMEGDGNSPAEPIAILIQVERLQNQLSPTWGQVAAAEDQGVLQIEEVSVLANAVEFKVDNRICNNHWQLWMDGQVVGLVEANSITTFETSEGPHSVCLTPEAQEGNCETPLKALIYQGYLLKPGC